LNEFYFFKKKNVFVRYLFLFSFFILYCGFQSGSFLLTAQPIKSNCCALLHSINAFRKRLKLYL